MTLSRRSAIKAIGIVGGGSALSGTALAVSEHEDDERDPDEEPDDGEVGAIRVGHFSPDAPNVDVYVDDQQILTDVAYDELSPYLEIAPGRYTLTITAAGDDEPVYEENFSVDTDYYTAAAIGEIEGDDEVEGPETAASIQDEDDDYEDEYVDDEDDEYVDDEDDEYVDDEDDLEEEAVDDEDDEDGPGTFDVLLLFDREAVEQEDTSMLRLVHASPDAPALDITDDQGLPLYEDVGFGEPSGYVSFEPGEQTLELFEAGENEFNAEFDEDDAVDDEETEEPETAAAIQDDEDDDLDLDDDEDDLDEDEVIDQPDPLASVDVDLEEDTVYTAFAIGYFEERDDLDDDRPFEIRVAIDGDEEEADDHDEAPDEAEPDEDEVDNGEDDYDDDPDADDDYDDEYEDGDDGYDDHDEEEEEPMTADD